MSHLRWIAVIGWLLAPTLALAAEPPAAALSPAGEATAQAPPAAGSAGPGVAAAPARIIDRAAERLMVDFCGLLKAADRFKCTILYGPKQEGYCYFEGAFFLYNQKTDKYVVADPPVGPEVAYLPGGYKTETIGGVEYLKLGPTCYRPYFKGDAVSYVVAKP